MWNVVIPFGFRKFADRGRQQIKNHLGFTSRVEEARATPPENRWIPVEERLPTENGETLVTLERPSGHRCVYHRNFQKDRWPTVCSTNRVIAWQPLPTTYKPPVEPVVSAETAPDAKLVTTYVMYFASQVAAELWAARDTHATPLRSPHEAYAVILEELEEFKAEVFKRTELRSRRWMRCELVQVAAMCQRAAEDLGLLALDDHDREAE